MRLLLLFAFASCSAPRARAQTAASLFGVESVNAWAVPPTVHWLHPPKGHVRGGTQLTIFGSGFQNSPYLSVRFAVETEFDEVLATYVSETQIVVETPERQTVHTTHVTASNDQLSYSGYPLIYIRGSGTFLKFVFDNSDPGCLDCRQSSAACQAGYGAGGNGCLNPYTTNEVWSADNVTGPYLGGTEITITSHRLNWPRVALSGTCPTGTTRECTQDTAGSGDCACTYPMFVQGSPQRYTAPVGGPGTPHPFDIDPNSPGNGPPVTGTFYPGRFLKCQFECYLDFDLDGTADALSTSEWIDAKWHDYTKITCISPPMEVPGRQNTDIPPTACTIRVTNNQQTFDQFSGATTTVANAPHCPGTCGQASYTGCASATGYNCPGTFVVFTYQDLRPVVTHIRSAQDSVWPARGPFGGNTEVTVTGLNFLPSRYLKCKFGGTTDSSNAFVQTDVSHIVGELGGRVRYISSTEIVCVTPTYGPASQTEQFPPVSSSAGKAPASAVQALIPGSGAVLEVATFTSSGGIASVTVVRGGHNYHTAPTLTVVGGGGCCARLTATVSGGSITAVTVVDGGKNYNKGGNAAGTAVLSTHANGEQVVSGVRMTDGGSGYLVPPLVYFIRPQPAGTTLPTMSYDFDDDRFDTSCFVTNPDIADGYLTDPGGFTPDSGSERIASPKIHARGVAALGFDPGCHTSFDRCQGQGAVTRVDVTYPGAYYQAGSPPTVVFQPMKPEVVVLPSELYDRNRNDPARIGLYTHQGKGPDELDPEFAHNTYEYQDEFAGAPRFPGGSHSASARSANANLYSQTRFPHGINSPEERGPLQAAKGEAFMDGSIKPSHLALVRVSNNYHKFGSKKGSDWDLTCTDAKCHRNYRDRTNGAGHASMGYWMWSYEGTPTSPTYADEVNRCRISSNPPIHQFGTIQGHGTDARYGLGTLTVEHHTFDTFRLFDGTSVEGGPGHSATATATLGDSVTYESSLTGVCTSADCTDATNTGAGTRTRNRGLRVIASIAVTNPGSGYTTPPTISFSGGGGCCAKATAVLSAGTVIRIDIDPNARGYGYTTAPTVHITPVGVQQRYDAVTPTTANYVDAAHGTRSDYLHVSGTAAANTVGHNTFNLDQTSLSVYAGPYRNTANLRVGHGAFPGHPGNLNLGHPKADCIYFLYGDIYVSPSGSDSTGQGTALRPYRTIQRCIDVALTGSRTYVVYKKADGGDRDPAVPDGTPRYGTESRGQRVDAATTGTLASNVLGGTMGPYKTGSLISHPGGRDKGYTGTRMWHKAGRITGSAAAGGRYGRGGWEDDTRDSTKGIGFTVNRDRCVLKAGVYTGAGNINLHPRGRVVQIWAEDNGRALIDCHGASLGKYVGRDTKDDEQAAREGVISMQGVVTKHCGHMPHHDPQHRPYYVGRPGYGPGTRHPNGQFCTPGARGCQFQTLPDGIPAGF